MKPSTLTRLFIVGNNWDREIDNDCYRWGLDKRVLTVRVCERAFPIGVNRDRRIVSTGISYCLVIYRLLISTPFTYRAQRNLSRSRSTIFIRRPNDRSPAILCWNYSANTILFIFHRWRQKRGPESVSKNMGLLFACNRAMTSRQFTNINESLDDINRMPSDIWNSKLFLVKCNIIASAITSWIMPRYSK